MSRLDHKILGKKHHKQSVHHMLVKHAVKHRKKHKRKQSHNPSKKHSDMALFIISVIVVLCIGGLFILDDYGMVTYGHAVAPPADAACACTGDGCTGLLPVQVGEFLVAEEIRGQKNICSTNSADQVFGPELNMLLIGERCILDDTKKVQFTYGGGKTKTFQNYCINNHRTIVPNSDRLGVIECEGKNVRITERACDCNGGTC